MRKICRFRVAIPRQYLLSLNFQRREKLATRCPDAVGNQVEISPAEGKLGVLLVGLGAVSTTFIAGVEAIKKGFAEPIGSLTQMGTIRLGKSTDNRVPLIKDLFHSPQLKDLVFGAWDIFPDSAYDAALNAGVLEKELLAQLKEPLRKSAHEGRLRSGLREAPQRHKRQDRQEQV